MRISKQLTVLSLSLVALQVFGSEPGVSPALAGRVLYGSIHPDLVAKAQPQIQDLQRSTGLSEWDTLALHNSIVDGRGQAHVRLQQFHKGLRVMGAEAILHLNGDGTPARPATAHHLVKGLSLASTQPAISADRALALVAKDLKIQNGAFSLQPVVELVIHPNVGGPQAAFIQHKDGTLSLDPSMTTFGRSSSKDPYILAYRVHVETENPQAGPLSRDYILDAQNGVILRKWNTLETLTAGGQPDPTDTPQGAPVPKLITGQSEYRGTVSVQGATASFLRTADDGTTSTFTADTLWDQIRGTLPHPRTGLTGNLTLNSANDPFAVFGFFFRPGLFFEHSAPGDWGDGQNYDWLGFDASGKYGIHAFDARGETAALDAHAGIADTWDFYANVLGRNGIDDLGTSVLGRVHFFANYPNAFWQTGTFTMSFGDGDGTDLKTVTSLDVMGHELSHGVTAYTSDLDYFGESGGINESNSDIMGTMVEFYSQGAGAVGSVVPDTGGNWTIGEQVAGTSLGGALRWFDRPSKDNFSADSWYQGVGLYDVHSSSGIGNRMYYYLSNGCSTVGDAATAYAPNGFPGIGNDKATRIWYRTLTVYLTSSSDYHDARAQALLAAEDLYGAGSAEVTAVENAFGAVNVGGLHGQPDPPMVTLDGESFVFSGNGPISASLSVIAAGEYSRPFKVAVQNAAPADQAVTWSLSYNDAGTIDAASGVFHAPVRWPFQLAGLDSNVYLIQAASANHPLQFARAAAYPVMADCDRDLEVDAVDMVAIAQQYSRAPVGDIPYLSALVGDPFGVSDLSVADFREAFSHIFATE